MKLIQYKDLFPTSSILYEKIKEFNYPSEAFEDENWFTQSVEKIFEKIHEVLIAKTTFRYFLWNSDSDNFQKLIDGLFLNAIWKEILNFYTKQLVFVKNELKDLVDWEKRGNLIKSENMGGENANSNSTEKGIEWDDEKDSASKKYKTKKNQNVTNRINDIKNILFSSLSYNFIEFFCSLEPYFIDKLWVDRKGLNDC